MPINREVYSDAEPEFIALTDTIPDEILEIDGIKDLDPLVAIKKYFKEDVSRWSTDPNSNITTKSPPGLRNEAYKPQDKYEGYLLFWRYLARKRGIERANEIIRSVFTGMLYINDLPQTNYPYCFAMDFMNVLVDGLPYHDLKSSPAKRLVSFMDEIRACTQKLSEQFAGAIGLTNALVLLAYFTEDCTDKEIENVIQSLIHNVNDALRPTGDSPFTNVSLFDHPTFDRLFGDTIFPNGEYIRDYWDEVDRIQHIYARFFTKGDPQSGRPYKFPVLTTCIHTDENGKIVDEEFFKFMADLNAERCITNWHTGSRLATCCRLTSDLSELKEKVRCDSFGNGGLAVGSHRVVTMNLHRLAMHARGDECAFISLLTHAQDMARDLLVVHKKDILRRRIDSGVLTFFDIGWCHPNQFFSTIGFIGLWDAYQELRPSGSYVDWAREILKKMEHRAKLYGMNDDDMAYNVEEIPGENAAVKLAMKDKYYSAGRGPDILSNQMVPLFTDIPFFDRIRIASELIGKVSGGSILHLNIADEMTLGANRELLRALIEKYKIPHFALNKGFSICAQDHSTTGLVEKCKTCGGPIVSVMTRVVGFFSPTSSWAPGRQIEFTKRQFYKSGDMVEVVVE